MKNMLWLMGVGVLGGVLCWYLMVKRESTMIDHISFAVENYDRSVQFYDQTLKILGYERVMTIDIPGKTLVAGYGKNGKPKFWIGKSLVPTERDYEEIGKARGFHVAFLAPNIQAIHDWYAKCLELGGTDNGAPGPRPQYHPGYYGAFIIDPDGWRIEAALHNYKA